MNAQLFPVTQQQVTAQTERSRHMLIHLINIIIERATYDVLWNKTQLSSPKEYQKEIDQTEGKST
jgi:hypothetical protein